MTGAGNVTGVEVGHEVRVPKPAGVTAITHQDLPVRRTIDMTYHERGAEVGVAPEVKDAIHPDIGVRVARQVGAVVPLLLQVEVIL